MDPPKERTARKLTKAEARARIGLVFGIQLVGIAITTIPLVRQGITTGGWQRDCLWIAAIAGGVSFVLLSVIHIVIGIRGVNVDLTERVIGLIFVLNTIAFSLAMARTGGPSCSLFGQIIPLQLSGILLLEQQKEKMTSQHSYAPVAYAGFAIAVWGIAVLSKDRLAEWLGWTLTTGGTGTESGYSVLAAEIIIASGMVFTVIAYFLPRSRRFIDFFVSD